MSIRVSRARVLALLVLLAISLAPVSIVLANALPPPVILWLDFVYETADQPELESVQLIGCPTLQCDQPTLLHQYGTCDSERCLDLTPALSARQPLKCLAGRCVVVFTNYGFQASPPFKIIGDFSDTVRESDLFWDMLPEWDTVVWQIIVQDASLVVSDADPGRFDPDDRYFGSIWQSLTLTVIVELLVAAAAMGIWLKIRGRSLLNGLAYVLLANLISYPVTWFLVPSLGRFQPVQVRQLSIAVAFLAIVFTALLAFMSRKEDRARRVLLVITLALQALAVIGLGLCYILTSMGRTYGSGALYAVAGLPPGLVILFAELFAIGFEAFLLWLLARKTLALSFRKAALISLLMNAASFLAGLALDSWL